MERNYLKEIIDDKKKLKIYILCFLIMLETMTLFGTALTKNFVLLPKQNPSAGIAGGADGPKLVNIKIEDIKMIERLIKLYNLEVDESQRQEAEEKGLLILINKQNPIGKDYKPDDLAPIKYYAADRSKISRYMRKEAADHFHKLVEAAAFEGYKLVMTTAYRSYEFQQILWNNYVANEGEEAASRFSARPGQSEHQSGLAVDVSSPSVDYALTEHFGETEEGKWIAGNAYKFGFILRFPKEKEEITGYLYEPWHIRYVGKPIAKEIYEKGLTLEEYLEDYLN